MKGTLQFASITLLLLIALSACGGAPPTKPAIPLESTVIPQKPARILPSATPEVQVVVPPASPATGTIPRELIEKARTDLSAYLDIDPDEIDVGEARAAAWPDASLGCPQPGLAYAEVITPGYWILLKAQGAEYPYHTDQGDQVVLCLGDVSASGVATPPASVIPVNPGEIEDGKPWMPVD